MYNIKKNELPFFYDEIKKQGAEVDEHVRQVSFDIPNNCIEHWVVQEYRDGLLRGSFYIRYDRTHPLNSPQRATEGCNKKIQDTLEAIRDK